MARTLQSQLILSLVDRVTAPARTIQAQMDRINGAIRRNEAALSEARGKMVDAAAGAMAVYGAFHATVGAAMSLEEKMADVGKVSDMSDEQLKSFEGSLRHLARTEIPMAVEELADLAASAAASGIADNDLEAFTRQVAKSAVAWNVSGDYAGEALAKIKSALGMTIDETARYADAMNFLSDTSASEAPGLIEFARRVAADGKIAGFTNEQVLALGSSMIAMGAEADVAATSLRNAQKALTRGASATKRQDAAFRKLGLHADDVAKAMPNDAMGQFLDVLERINALDQHERISTMSDLFGDEARALMPLLAQLDDVRETTAAVADETNYLGSVQKEFEIRSKTGRYALRRFFNQLRDIAIIIGNSLLPGMKEILERMSPILLAVGKWTEENARLVATVMSVTASLVGLRVALLSLRYLGLLGKGGALSLLAFGMNTVGRAGAAVYGAVASSIALRRSIETLKARKAADVFGQIAVGLQQVSSPVRLTAMHRLRAILSGLAGVTGLTAVSQGIAAVGAVIAGISAPVWAAIALAVAAVGAAWKYWDRISPIVRGVADAIGTALQPVFEKMRGWLEPVEPLLEGVGDAFGFVGEKVGALIDFAKSIGAGLFSREILTDGEQAELRARAAQITADIISYFTALPGRLRTIGGEIIQGLWDGMKSRYEDFIAWAKSIPNNIANAITGGVKGPISSGYDPAADPGDAGLMLPPSYLQAKAVGGHMRANVPTLVGERGPEAIFPTRAGWVAHAGQVKALAEMSRRIRPMPDLSQMVRAMPNVPKPRAVQSPPRREATSNRPVSVTFGNIVVQGGSNASARDISREIGNEVQARLRGTFTDPY